MRPVMQRERFGHINIRVDRAGVSNYPYSENLPNVESAEIFLGLCRLLALLLVQH